MIVKTIELILEKVETNQRLLKELIESLTTTNKPKKTTKPKRTTNSLGNPKTKTPKFLKVESDHTIDELIKMVEKTPETTKTKKPKDVRKLAEELDLKKIKEVPLSELVSDLRRKR